MSIEPVVRVDAVLSGKAALDWKKDALELKIVVRNVSRRYGLLQDLAYLRIDDGGEEVPVWLTLMPFAAQQRLSLYEDGTPNTTEEPQDAPTSAGQSTGESGPDAPTDATSDGGENPPEAQAVRPFEMRAVDYEGTGLPLYTVSANLDMAQLAEAAYQAGLPPCAIELIRSVERMGETTHSTMLYHYRGVGDDPVIRRVPSPQFRRWIEELRAVREAQTA